MAAAPATYPMVITKGRIWEKFMVAKKRELGLFDLYIL
jgi:hypothetical protein